MNSRPVIFISAVSKELRQQRELVAKTLRFLGCDPVIQDEFGTETGAIREMLSKKVAPCDALIQLVGHALGGVVKEAVRVSEVMSYTQFEADFAEKANKRVWYLLIADTWRLPFCDADGNDVGPETQDETDDQRTYRRKIKRSPQLFHTAADEKELEIAIFKMLRELDLLRNQPTPWLSTADSSPAHSAGASAPAALTKEEARQLLDEFVQKVIPVRQEKDESKEEASEDALIAQLAVKRGQSADDVRRLLNQTAVEVQQDEAEPAIQRARAAFARREYAAAEALAIEASKEKSEDSKEQRAQCIAALELAGNAAREQIHYAQALDHYRAAATLTDEQRAPLEWARVQSWIAYVLDDDGQARAVEPILRRVVEVQERTLGAEHPDTLGSRNNLAVALGAQGKNAEAEQEHRAVLNVREHVLGAEHPDTLGSRNNLANALQAQGKNAEAEQEHRAVLKVRERVLGAEHPNTLSSRNNLAAALGAQGKNAEAEQEHRAVLNVRECVLGAEHPDTLSSRMNLANALDAQRKHAEAEQEYRAVLKVQERVLGAEHPDVATSCYNLALCLESQKKLPEALAFMQWAEQVWTKALGTDHPDTKDATAACERIEAAMK